MQYRSFLKNSPPGCPFCQDEAFDPTVLVTSNRRAMVTVAKAPYVEDQLLVIPKRHVVHFSELKLLEAADCFRLIRWAGQRIYKMGHPGYNIIIRDGENVGKSIPHLHIHLVPNLDLQFKNSTHHRHILTKIQIKRIVKNILKSS